jgi:hypothetical protein
MFRDAHGNTVPCTPENIGRLDRQNPLVKKALQEIGERNADDDSAGVEGAQEDGEGNPIPNLSTNGGAPSSRDSHALRDALTPIS